MNLSAGWLATSLLVSSVGVGFFVYGKKQLRLPHFAAGVVLLLESVFVPSVGWMIGSAVAVLAVLWTVLRAGY